MSYFAANPFRFGGPARSKNRFEDQVANPGILADVGFRVVLPVPLPGTR
jgi:hypothetical protein